MISIPRLKEELRFTRDLGDIVDLLKSATMAQSRLFQAKEKPHKAFIKELEESFRLFAAELTRHPYFSLVKDLPQALIVVTSNEGFSGELNNLLVNACLDKRSSKNDEIIVLGERGVRYLEEAGEVFKALPGISDEIDYKEVEKICAYLLEGFHKGRFGSVSVIYPEFVSLTLQRISEFRLLPCVILKDASSGQSGNADKKEELLIEPSVDRVARIFIKLWIEYRLFDVFCSAKQSEYAARLMHLEGSTQELMHLNRGFAYQYFRQIHALNDKTIREVSSSRILLERRRI